MKLVPAIDLMEGSVVRLYRGDPAQKTVYSDDPVGVARRWESEGADMLHIVDLDATLGRGSNAGVISEILRSVGVDAEVAGGLRSEGAVLGAARDAARVVIGTLAFRDRVALASLRDALGAGRIVISIDHRDGRVLTHGWQQASGLAPVDAARGFLEMGFTEFLLTDVSRDGTLGGPDLDVLGQVCSLPGARVIASGGISGPADIPAVRGRGAHGVILGKALYDGRITMAEAAGP